MQTVQGRSAGRQELAFAGVIVLIVAAMAVIAFPPATQSPPTTRTTPGIPDVLATIPEGTSGNLSSFQTYQGLHQFIADNAKATQQLNAYFSGGIAVPGINRAQGGITMTMTSTVTMTAASTSAATLAAGAAAGPAGAASSGFTTTNNQVQGVDELDKVKTDGSYLFVATSQSVSIISARSASTSLVSTIKLPGSSIMGIELTPQRLAIISQGARSPSVGLRLYDVSTPSSPVLLSSVNVNGSHVAARVSQGYIYEIVQQPSYVVSGNANVTAKYPTLVEDGVTSALSPSSTYYTPNKSQISVYTMVVSMSMTTGAEKAVAVLTGPSSTVYASTSNIYVAYPNYPSYFAHDIQGNVFTGSGFGFMQPQNTTIFRVAYASGDVSVKSAGSFPGVVLNQFSMDEYNGYFRVATSRVVAANGGSSRSDDVYVLAQNFTQLAALQNIAPGENLYAVRFLGDTGYVVTFEQIDPLFTISFKDPIHPAIQSALKSSGFSDYLHPFGSEYLIGVGKDATPSQTGNFAWVLGLKLSLFHVAADGTSTEVSRYLIGDRGTDSPVLNDHLAFTFDATRSIMVIPVALAKVQGGQTQTSGNPPPTGQVVWQGVYVMNVTTSGFNLLGTVTQNPPGVGVQTYWGGSSGHVIDRSVIIGNSLYTVSQDEVMASDLSNFSTLATVSLA